MLSLRTPYPLWGRGLGDLTGGTTVPGTSLAVALRGHLWEGVQASPRPSLGQRPLPVASLQPPLVLSSLGLSDVLPRGM